MESPSERMSRWGRRHFSRVLACVLFLLLSVAALGISSVQINRARQLQWQQLAVHLLYRGTFECKTDESEKA